MTVQFQDVFLIGLHFIINELKCANVINRDLIFEKQNTQRKSLRNTHNIRPRTNNFQVTELQHCSTYMFR